MIGNDEPIGVIKPGEEKKVFQYQFENGMNLINGKTVLKRMKPWIELENGDIIYPVFRRAEKNCFYFEDENGKASLSIRFECKDNLVAVYVDVECAALRFSYANMNYLSAECAVGLEIEDIGDIEGYTANYLYSEYWMKPYMDTQLSNIPKDTQALLWKYRDESYGYLLTACDKEYKSSLKGSQSGIKLSVFSHAHALRKCESLAFILCMDNDVFEAIKRTTAWGLELLNNGAVTREERRYPEIFEYLGWCSWDAFQLEVNHNGLLEKAEEFKEKGIPVRWFLIDDMWADVKNNDSTKTSHQKMLWDFEADPLRFPKGLKGVITDLKEQYRLAVGMWHPTTGYWYGIDPNGEIARKYGHLLLQIGDGRLIPDPSLEKSFLFYNAFHEFLRACGADFVKIDNQSYIRGFLKHVLPVGKAARQLHRAMEASVGINFDNKLLNCMGMAIENIWNRPHSAISRCSNDFLPENRQWFINHILQCSYNSLVQGSFLWCDWDMWWTDDEQATKNSVLRAISGGPVYVSDKLNRSIKSKIMPLVYSDGRILRCDQPAVPCRDCLIDDPEKSGKIFKVWNTSGQAGIVAIFNLDAGNGVVDGQLSVTDVPTLAGEKFLLFEHFTKDARVLEKDEALPVMLKDHDDFRLYVIVPVINGFAPVGLTEKYISPAAVHQLAPGKLLLKEGGTFAFYSERVPDSVFVNGQRASLYEKNGLYYTDCREDLKDIFIEVILSK